MKSKATGITLVAFIAAVVFSWGASLPVELGQGLSTRWDVYEQSLYLTGVLSIALMSLTMVLATRPVWLEPLLGGLDRIYQLHKWAGILAVSFGVAHWLVEMGDDWIKDLFGRGARLAGADASGMLDSIRDAAEDLGEWGIYLAIGMLLLSLWRAFPYKFWRYLHRGMPALYLLLVFHAAWLLPVQWWTQPVGLLLAPLLLAGSLASLHSMGGRVGHRRKTRGRVVSVRAHAAGITEVVCQLDAGWQGHRPGQFALVSFERLEGAHPFTIASADQGDARVTFQIKALGDYTRDLASRLNVGQPVLIEGPYGCFDYNRSKPGARQIWVAAGVGVTPFLAWLEECQNDPARAPAADLHYCTRDAASDPLAARLGELCATLPSIRLRIHDSHQGERLTADQLALASLPRRGVDLWFCGPVGLARSLREGMRTGTRARLRFHQEAFQMR